MMIGVFVTMIIAVLFNAIGLISPIISLAKCKKPEENDMCLPY